MNGRLLAVGVILVCAGSAQAVFTDALVTLANLNANHSFALAGPGTNTMDGKTRRQRVTIPAMPPGMPMPMDVDIDVAKGDASAQLRNAADDAAGTKTLRLQAMAEANRLDNRLGHAGLPAQQTSSAIAVAGASAEFTLPRQIMDGGQMRWVRGYKIRIDGNAGSRLEGSRTAGGTESWSATMRRDIGGTPTTFTTTARVAHKVLVDKARRAAIQSDAVNSGGADSAVDVDPQALVNGGDSGPTILTAQPGTFVLSASLRVDASATSIGATVAAHRGARGVANAMDPANSRRMVVKPMVETGQLLAARPEAWQDPRISFDGTTVFMDNGPLAGLGFAGDVTQFVDDGFVSDPLLTPLLSDPLSQTLSISPFSVTGVSGGFVQFTDATFSLSVLGNPVLAGVISNIQAGTSPGSEVFEGDINITFNDAGFSPWLASLSGRTDLKFSFDPEMIGATNGWTTVGVIDGVNLIVPAPGTGLLAAGAMLAGARRRRRG
ncbi:MAG: hypothetical protein SFZ24_04795 [Planctomycetota bacterium]|nr:hypothetical protein [Planctomycetota bacterium]